MADAPARDARGGANVLALLIVFVDMAGVSLIAPLLPQMGRAYGFGAIAAGVLLAAFPLMQAVGGYALGNWADRIGPRPALVAAQSLQVAGYVVFALAADFTLLLIARAATGFASGSIAIAQSLSIEGVRHDAAASTKVLGRLGAASAMGFLFGQGLVLLIALSSGGGEVEVTQGRTGLLVAALMAAILLLVLASRHYGSGLPPGRKREATALAPLARPLALYALTTWVFVALSGFLGLWLENAWGRGPATTTVAFIAVAVLVGVVQSVVVPIALNAGASSRRLVSGGFLTSACGVAMMASTPLVAEGGLVLGLAGYAVAGIGYGLLVPTLLGRLGRIAAAGALGGAMGAAVVAANIGSILGPITTGLAIAAASYSPAFAMLIPVAVAGWLLSRGDMRA